MAFEMIAGDEEEGKKTVKITVRPDASAWSGPAVRLTVGEGAGMLKAMEIEALCAALKRAEKLSLGR